MLNILLRVYTIINIISRVKHDTHTSLLYNIFPVQLANPL